MVASRPASVRAMLYRGRTFRRVMKEELVVGKMVVALVGASVVLMASATAAEKEIDRDLYVVLYQRRVELAEAKLAYLLEKHGRLGNLKQRNAISKDEYEVSRLEVAVARNQVSESKALLDICRARRENGLEMPIYPGQANY